MSRPSWALPALWLGACTLPFAGPFFRLADPADPLVKAGWRLCMASVFYLPFTIMAWRRGRLTPRIAWRGTAAGALYGIHFGTWVASLGLTSVAASTTLATSTPLILGIIAWLLGRDAPTWRQWAALAVATAGVILIGSQGSGGSHAISGDLLALASAVAMALYMINGRSLGRDLDVFAFSGLCTGIGGALLLLASGLRGVELWPPSAASWGYLVLATLIPQLLGHSLLTWSLRHATPSEVGMATLVEPVGAAFLAWIWLGEGLTGGLAVGSALILASVAAEVMRTARLQPSPAPAS